MEPSPDHQLTGHYPTKVVKSLRLTENNEFHREIKHEDHRPDHLKNDRVECKCGESWEGIDAEQKAKNHLLRETAATRIHWKHKDAEYADWELRYDKEASTLYWSLNQPSKFPLELHATPFYNGEDGIVIHIPDENDGERIVERLAEDRDPEEIIEDYVEIMTQYIYETWIVP